MIPTSPKSPVSPLNEWRARLPEGAAHKQKPRCRTDPKKKKKSLQSQSQPRMSLLGPNMRHTIHANSSTGLTSVKNSDFARCTIGNHELKLLHTLESADSEDYATTYAEFRRKLLEKTDSLKTANLSRPKKNIAKLKMAVSLAKGNKLALLSKAQLAFSPLNPDNKKDTTALMKKIRQMKLEAGLDADDSAGQVQQGVDLEFSDPIPHDETMDSQKEKEIEKVFKYVVGEHTSSPFTSDIPVVGKSSSETTAKTKKLHKKGAGHQIVGNTGVKESASLKDLRNRGFVKNSQALRKKKLRAQQKAAAAVDKNVPQTNNKSSKTKSKTKAQTHPYLADKYSEEQQKQAKLPEKLRQACDKKYDKLMEPFVERNSAVSWSRIKAREDSRKEKEAITITGTFGQPFTASRSLQMNSSIEQMMSRGPESPTTQDDDLDEVRARLANSAALRQNDDDLISGDAMLYAMEREGLFTVDDLEELSINSNHSEEMLSDGSEAGLFNTLDLLELDVDEQDPVLHHEDDIKTPDGALSASVGALLFSPKFQQEVSTRPASAGLGGVTRSFVRPAVKSPGKQDLFSYHNKYSIGDVKRPKSANTSPHVRSSSDYENIREIPNHVQKKRLVVNRHRTPEVWIS